MKTKATLQNDVSATAKGGAPLRPTGPRPEPPATAQRRPSSTPIIIDDRDLELEARVASGSTIASPGTAPAQAPSQVARTLYGGGGMRLPEQTRSGLAERFGASVDRVRIHTDEAAAAAAATLDAAAFTSDSDIYFGPGRFAPGTERGDRLLAHEFAHTIQQRRHPGGIAPVIQLQPTQTEEKQAAETEETAADKPPPKVVKDDLNYAFFFAGGDYGEAARKYIHTYYPTYKMVAAQSFEEMFDRLWA